METEDELTDIARRQLVEVLDTINRLPPDAFAHKHELNTVADELRSFIAANHGPEADALRAAWAERAGRKGEHEVDYEILKALAQAPIDGGASGS